MDIEQHASNYKFAASQFVTQFDAGLKINLDFVARLFNNNCNMTLGIFSQKNNNMSEISDMCGFKEFKHKLHLLNINSLHYQHYVYTCHMLSNKLILIMLHGNLMINQLVYPFLNTIVIKPENFTYTIENFVLHIFIN